MTALWHKPNLLFVFSDQQSSDMLGSYGNPSIITPQLDRFAAGAVRFRHAIANCPMCTPSRGIMLSGLHPLHHGAVANDWQMLPGHGQYFGEILRDADYRIGYFGKWHLHGGDRDRPVPAGPLRYGFDHDFVTNNCTLEYRAGHAWYWDNQGDRHRCPEWEPRTQTTQALTFLDDVGRSGQPWALFVSWHPPHDWKPPNWDTFPPGYAYAAPDEPASRYDSDSIWLRPNSPDTSEQRRIYHGHYALCSDLDDQFGRLLRQITSMDQVERTIIVYTSDHGDDLRSTGRYAMHKGRPEAESVRVPLLVRAPGLRHRVSDLIIGTLDLMPTLLSLLGLAPPSTCHGRDVSGAIRAEEDDAVDSAPLMLSQTPSQDWRGVYTRRYTYSFGPDGERFNRLYDRRSDPYEQRNLFDDSACEDVRRQLHILTLHWMAGFGDRFVRCEQLHEHCLQTPATPGRVYRERSGAVKGRPIELVQHLAGWIEQEATQPMASQALPG